MIRRYFIAPDGDNEPTVWEGSPDDDRPVAVLRRCEIPPARREVFWAFLVEAIA